VELRRLLSETEVDRDGKIVFTKRTKDFRRFIQAYNNAVALTSLGDVYPVEYFNTIEVAKLPHHEFKVKVGPPLFSCEI
jgi:hypothetical protein